MAFLFGLIHGMGFASVLLDLGFARGNLALALVGFNLAVEVGQLAVAASGSRIDLLLKIADVVAAAHDVGVTNTRLQPICRLCPRGPR